ncbi:MAG: proteasome accessory factor PafA2 family protein [Chlorobia bacterium]|nr:proteasome accessory factor PafA2 family protein [Fimbriimonadaceae bacterium]
MRRILAGIETEYGLLVEDRGAEDQIDDAMALVRGYPGECLALWDYRYESPRADLRGFQLERLAVDPIDMEFDKGRDHGKPVDVRSDRILPNGARFYNDHGHPEYSTPECFSLRELALHDVYGEHVVLEAARTFAQSSEREVKVFKNNTDFHGASYGTHENYLVPRSVGFERLYKAILPMLIVRQILTGAGKVGTESGDWCDFQLSQRADFFMESVNAETLFRRPIFNTRDECHADPGDWIRLHVISGDANMMPSCTMRKVGLVKLAIHLAEADQAPVWNLRNPVNSIQSISKDMNLEGRIELDGRSWTTAYEVLESYFAAAEATLDLDDELKAVILESRDLIELLKQGEWKQTRSKIDWAAKRNLLEDYLGSEGGSWKDTAIRAFDLEYHNIDREESLYYAIEEMGDVPSFAQWDEIDERSCGNPEGTRALARSIAVTKFKSHVHTACWRSITFKIEDRLVEVELKPDIIYPSHLRGAGDVETFIRMLRGQL